MDGIKGRTFSELVEEVGRFHGHVCGGIRIGTRMAVTGLERVGLGDPRGADRKKLLVYVECDRCATDAILVVTGCTPGKRSMKVLDYGKFAATFVNLESGRAVRIAPGRARDAAEGEPDWAHAPAEELFTISEVKVAPRPEDLPGKPKREARCARCGEHVVDGREVEQGGETLCRPCADGHVYYQPLPKAAR